MTKYWMRKFIDIANKTDIDEGLAKNLGLAATAAATIAGASAAAHAVGKSHGDVAGASRSSTMAWDGNGDPHEWGEGDWFNDSPANASADKPEQKPKGLFSFLNKKEEPPVQKVHIPENDLAYMAATLWGEARSEGDHGMRAVAHVIKNRMAQKREKWGVTPKSVSTAKEQFSAWNSNDPNRSKMLRMIEIDREVRAGRIVASDLKDSGELRNYQIYRKAKKIARAVLTGDDEDFTGGADHYHTTAVSPYWKDSMGMIKQVGNHVFYDSKKKPTNETAIQCNCGCPTLVEESGEDALLPRQYRIRSRYDYFNRTVFGGSLPDNIPLSFVRMEGKTGSTIYRYVSETEEYVEGSVSIRMSNRYKRTMESFDAVLLHEMIHVEDVVLKGRVNQSTAHDEVFVQRAKEVSAQTGINITVTDDETDSLELTASGPRREYLVMVLDDGAHGGKVGVAKFSSKLSEKQTTDLLIRLSGIAVLPTTTRLELFRSDSPLFGGTGKVATPKGDIEIHYLADGKVLTDALQKSKLLIDFMKLKNK